MLEELYTDRWSLFIDWSGAYPVRNSDSCSVCSEERCPLSHRVIYLAARPGLIRPATTGPSGTARTDRSFRLPGERFYGIFECGSNRAAPTSAVSVHTNLISLRKPVSSLEYYSHAATIAQISATFKSHHSHARRFSRSSLDYFTALAPRSAAYRYTRYF